MSSQSHVDAYRDLTDAYRDLTQPDHVLTDGFRTRRYLARSRATGDPITLPVSSVRYHWWACVASGPDKPTYWLPPYERTAAQKDT